MTVREKSHRVDGTLGTHNICLVGVDLAIGESHVAIADVDTTSLPKAINHVKSEHPIGSMGLWALTDGAWLE